MNEAANTVQVSFAILITVITTLCGVIATMYIYQRKDKKEDTKTILDMTTNIVKIAANSHDVMINATNAIKENTTGTRQNTDLLISIKTILETIKK